jgi:ribonuclease P protein component
VERNRLKRRLREILRRELIPRLRRAGLEVDIIVRARRDAYGPTYADLRAELIELADRRWLRGSSSS